MGPNDAYDLIVVGTGFGGSFFLHEYLRRAAPTARVLVLERGQRHAHAWHIRHYKETWAEAERQILNRAPAKPWRFELTFGGSSNCWWACTPRMLPEDFELRWRYGVGEDWPIGYDDLEAYYTQAEELMAVSGPDDGSPFPRSRPYPQPPHRLTEPDRLLKRAYPDQFFAMPSARARRTTPAGRPRCCASGVCHACPIDSKFTILNEMAGLYEDARVELRPKATVQAVEFAGDAATGVRYLQAGRERVARGELIALAANGLFNPHILLRSGLEHPALGRGLTEQTGLHAHVLLEGVNNFGGSTSLTGHGYMLYAGPHRARRAGALLETSNIPHLRPQRGRWLQYLRVKAIFEDLRRDDNRVAVSAEDPTRPEVHYAGRSAYTTEAIGALRSDLERALAPLPISRLKLDPRPNDTESHIIGTTVMGTDPARSVVDADLRHHRLRNVVVLGSSVFPTAAPANPTLTITALALRAARRLFVQER